jgi:hypothetical protein
MTSHFVPLHSPAAERNLQPILAELQRILPAQGKALEIASGTGQHIAGFAQGLPLWQWQPSDAQPDAFDSIAHWCAQAGAANVLPPRVLNVLAPDWLLPSTQSVGVVDAVLCINMLHIAPWACCAALMEGAARHLAPQGQLITYGPYLEAGVPTAASNLAFDADLRQRNPAWGIRPLVDVVHQAHLVGLQLHARVALPANNLLLVFAR